jgi:hypothetical protein
MRTYKESSWQAVPDYHPYRVSGDFNGDGIKDFAVVLKNRKDKSFALVIFNGPLNYRNPTPAFIKSGLDMVHMGLFYGPPRPKPYHLILGPFESEGIELIPKGRTYKME